MSGRKQRNGGGGDSEALSIADIRKRWQSGSAGSSKEETPKSLSKEERKKWLDIINDKSIGFNSKLKADAREALYGKSQGGKAQINLFQTNGGRDFDIPLREMTRFEYAATSPQYKAQMDKDCPTWEQHSFGTKDPNCKYAAKASKNGGAESGKTDRRTYQERALGITKSRRKSSFSRRKSASKSRTGGSSKKKRSGNRR